MTKSWQFLSGPGSLPYRLFDALRNGLNRRLTRWLRREGIPDGGKVLEAGSGPGFASSLLRSDPGVRLSVALDIDLEALREARRRDPRLPVVVGDLRNLPFRDGAFDLVWNSSTFEHLPQQDRVAGEMARCARPGGAVFIGVPYRCGPLYVQREIARSGAGVWLGTVYLRRQLEAFMTPWGLRPLKAMTYFLRFFIGVIARKEAP
jgi:SAM-dependent methyltransferase